MGRSWREWRTDVAVGLAYCLLAPAAWAAELTVTVLDGQAPLVEAVVSVHSSPATAPASNNAIMDQRNSQFVPGVLAIQVGTSVTFPNSDKVRHQVYSFSRAKAFELPLYAGTPAAPVRFDRVGIAVVGCNIHDWMIGYIVVLDTPLFAKTGADGRARLSVPPGQYTLRAWHARLAGEAGTEPLVVAGEAALARVLRPALAAPAPPRASARQRALLEKLRAEQQAR